MAELVYSDNALNAKAAFFRAEIIAYVEGDDDVAFWETIFSALTKKKIHVEECGGREEVEKWIEKISAGTVDAISALDRDHRFHTDERLYLSPKILFTFGHSVENTLFTPITTAKVIRAVSRKSCDESTCAEWFRRFMLSVRPLVVLDIANEIGGCGENTIGDNCSRFMQDLHVCPSKIRLVSEPASKKIPKRYIDSAKMSLRKRGETTMRSVRGHFLHSAILKYVSLMCEQLNRRVSLSNDALYALFLSNFENQFTPKHPHYAFYKNQVHKMTAAI